MTSKKYVTLSIVTKRIETNSAIRCISYYPFNDRPQSYLTVFNTLNLRSIARFLCRKRASCYANKWAQTIKITAAVSLLALRGSSDAQGTQLLLVR